MEVEDIVFQNLFNDDVYTRAVLPYLQKEYFTDNNYKIIFNQFNEFFSKYNVAPTTESFIIDLESIGNISQDQYNIITDRISSYKIQDEIPDHKWLLDTTEQFCSDRAIFNAVQASIKILSGEDENKGKGAIPELLQDALAVSFDSSVGHEYIENAAERYDLLHLKEDRIPFGIKYMDKVTGGGLPNKTLNVFMAHSGGGKSAFLINYACNAMLVGKKVLYISLELSEERIAERIDSNLLRMSISDVAKTDKDKYVSLVESIKNKTVGEIIIKEYPTASAHVGHFRHLIRELKTKKNFVPDIIFIDYLNICASSRAPAGSNSYTIVKSIAEEIRGFATENVVPIISATQANRNAQNASDMEMSDVSESYGLVSTVDTLFAMISTEELREQGKIMIKQLKNRFSDISQNSKCMLGVDFSQMRFFDLEQEVPFGDDIGKIKEKPSFNNDMFDKPKEGMFSGFKI